MKSKHTPGPWMMEEYQVGIYTVLPAPQIAIRIDSEYSNEFVDIYSGTNDTEDDLYEEAIANAKLIAAAPDMLEALNEMVISFDILDIETDSLQREAIRNAKEAIKKATGQ